MKLTTSWSCAKEINHSFTYHSQLNRIDLLHIMPTPKVPVLRKRSSLSFMQLAYPSESPDPSATGSGGQDESTMGSPSAESSPSDLDAKLSTYSYRSQSPKAGVESSSPELDARPSGHPVDSAASPVLSDTDSAPREIRYSWGNTLVMYKGEMLPKEIVDMQISRDKMLEANSSNFPGPGQKHSDGGGTQMDRSPSVDSSHSSLYADRPESRAQSVSPSTNPMPGDGDHSRRGSIKPMSRTDSHGLGSLIGVTEDGDYLHNCGTVIERQVVALSAGVQEMQQDSQRLFEKLTAQKAEWEARAKEQAALDENERMVRLENQRLREIARAKEEADWECQQAEIDRKIEMGEIPTGPKSR